MVLRHGSVFCWVTGMKWVTTDDPWVISSDPFQTLLGDGCSLNLEWPVLLIVGDRGCKYTQWLEYQAYLLSFCV